MRAFHRWLVVALTVAVVAVVAAAAGIIMAPQPLRAMFRHGPKVAVDQAHLELGVIENPDEFAQKFVFRNQGDRPLGLAAGPSSCSCTVTDLPPGPIPPGGRAVVGVGFNEATKHDTLKTGRLLRSMTVLTNDPDRPRVLLEIGATVVRNVAAAPAAVTLSLQTSDLSAEAKRSAETVIYSETWDRFDLADVQASRPGMRWRIGPATKEELTRLAGRSGYRVRVTLPPDMPDGRFAETIDFCARPPAAAGSFRRLQLRLQGSIDGRLTLYGGRIDRQRVLRLGVLQEGESVQENLVMKVNDEHPLLVIEKIETEPAFLQVQVSPCGSKAAQVGLYRITVGISHAPPCNFADPQFATIRLKTNHPRLPVIELRADFAVVSAAERLVPLAGR